MPLHTDHPMFVGFMLDGFDHAVGSNRRNAQAAPKVTDGLMMGSVYLRIESAGTIREAASCCELGELAACLDLRRMDGIGRIRRKSFFAVLDFRVQLAGYVLVEGSAKANVEALAAIADGQNRLARSESVLQDREVRLLPIGIGLVRLFVACGVVERRINVRWASRKHKGVQIF